jgi:hypothetical protein
MNEINLAASISIFVGLLVLGIIDAIFENRLTPRMFGFTIGVSVFLYTAVVIQLAGSRVGWVLGVFPGLLLGWGAQLKSVRSYRDWRDEHAPEDDLPPNPDPRDLFR